MKREEEFKKWLQRGLQEETKDIYFTAQAKEEVRRRILEQQKQSGKVTALCSPAERKSAELLQNRQQSWWRQEFTFSLKAVSLCLAFLILLGTFYTRTFFYVSPQQLAKFEQREKIILYDEGVPFGAMQHLVASLGKVKGVDRP